jgi:hypothetical protein
VFCTVTRFTLEQAMKALGGVDYRSILSLTLALEEVGGQRPVSPLYPRERSSTHGIGRLVGPRAGMNGAENLTPHRGSISGTSSHLRVAIPTTLFRPTYYVL